MFKIKNNRLIILDENRNVLYPAGLKVTTQDVFTVYSVSKLNEFLTKGNGTYITVEQRKEVLSISFGQLTIEVGTFCPPICD